MSEREQQLLRRQTAIADFGDLAIRSDDLDEVLTEACRLAAEALGTARAMLFEIGADGRTLFLRTAAGLPPQTPRDLRLPIEPGSPEGLVIENGAPLICRDTAAETRFAGPGALAREGIRAFASVPVFAPGRTPCGLLQAEDTVPRDFDEGDIQVLRTCATLAGLAADRIRTLQRLRDSQDRERERDLRFRTIFDTAPVGLSVISAAGRFLRVNGELSRILGRTQEELVGRTVEEVTHEADVSASVSALRQSLATGETTTLDKQYRRPSGELVPANSTLTPLRTADNATAILAVTVDLGSRRRAEQALRESEERFRALVTAGTYSVYRMSPDWRLMFQLDSDTLANPAGPIEDWVEKYILEEDRPRVFAAIREAVATKSLFELEHRVRLADGGIGWVLSRAVPLLGPYGEITEWFGAGSDITERRATVERLRASEERHRIELERHVEEATAELKASRDLLQATMNASSDMIQVFEAVRDEAGEIVDFKWILTNNASVNRVGEVRGKSLLTRNPGVRIEGIFETFKRVTETGVPDQAERHYAHEQFDGWYYQSVVKLNDGVATTTKDISDWKKAQEEILRLEEEAAAAKLRQSEERYRLILENALDYAIFTTDREGIVTSWPAGAEAVFGWSAEEMIGQDVAITFTPEDRAAGEPRGERDTAEREGWAPNVRWHLRSDGQRIFIDGSTRPMPGSGGGETGGFIKIGQDVTKRREAEQQLRENRRRLWTVIQGIPQLVWRAVEVGHWTWASPQWTRYTGQTLEESQGLGWLGAVHPDDREQAMEGWQGADGSAPLSMETRLFHAEEGRYRWFQTRALPVRDEDGRIVEWVGTSTDIDDMRQLQERQQVLVAELQHRTRNLLGVVRSIGGRTAAGVATIADFLLVFDERLSALSRINGLLSKLEQGQRLTFDELLRTELGARGILGQDMAGRVVLEGPAGVQLRSVTVQTFALAIHELTTNAVKYGALSGEKGRLTVLWGLSRDAEGREHLHVEWTESGVAGMPADEDPAKGGGYGRELIERALPYQLHAKTSYELGPDGVRCTIDLPLT